MISKILGYDFHVEIKPGRHYIVADALYHRNMEAADGNLLVLSAPHFALFDDLRQEAEGDTTFGSLRLQIVVGQLSLPWSFSDSFFLMGMFVFRCLLLACSLFFP